MVRYLGSKGGVTKGLGKGGKGRVGKQGSRTFGEQK